jgi:thymidylate kinase
MKQLQPHYFSLSGIDGAGKSSIIQALKDSDWGNLKVEFVKRKSYANLRKIETLFKDTPATDWLGGYQSKVTAMSCILDFLAGFQEVVAQTSAADIVFMDRHVHCYTAYLQSTGIHLDTAQFFNHLVAPTINFHIGVPVDVAFARCQQRQVSGPDESLEALRAYDEAYKNILNDNLPFSVEYIDNTRPVKVAAGRIHSIVTGLYRPK